LTISFWYNPEKVAFFQITIVKVCKWFGEDIETNQNWNSLSRLYEAYKEHFNLNQKAIDIRKNDHYFDEIYSEIMKVDITSSDIEIVEGEDIYVLYPKSEDNGKINEDEPENEEFLEQYSAQKW
jgi:hypothetical protein